MKKVILSIILVLCFCISTIAQTVYVSEGGKKFHKKNCSSTNPGKKGISINEAKRKGLNACKICNPEATEEKKKKPEKKK